MYDKLVKRLRYCSEERNGCGMCALSSDCVLRVGLLTQAADAIEELFGKVEQLPRWIPVTEKPPKAYEDVLLLFPHNQAVGFCDRDGCWGVYSGDGFYTEVADNEPKPTHWARKLPEPPKEEET